MSPLGKLGVALAALCTAAVAVLIFLRIFFFGYVDNYEVGYLFHGLTGQIEKLDRKGYISMAPWDSLGTIDLRPMQVCIAANNRVLNCKLIKFNPDGLMLFLSWHGRNYASNTTVPENSSTTALAEILKSYAYDGTGKSYPFLTIIREMKTDEVSK